MAFSLGSLRSQVSARLGDATQTIWGATEIDGHLRNALQLMANVHRLFWDWHYSENLPPTFSRTAVWEASYETFATGLANFTYEDERAASDQVHRIGPAWSTSPYEATDGDLSRAVASTHISATDDLPTTVVGLSRGVYDRRGIDMLTVRDMKRSDARYELTTGEVYGLLWQKDGIRTIRKVRVPATQADTWTIHGSWGAMRETSDLSTDAASTIDAPALFSFTASWERPTAAALVDDFGWTSHTMDSESAWVTDTHQAANHTAPWEATAGWLAVAGAQVTWTMTRGVPRRIPGEHPIGPWSFGAPRRPYRDGKNVRVEHYRHGRAMTTSANVCELPDRYALYLRDYAQARLLARRGPGQDLKLSQHFDARWARGLARVQKRTVTLERQRAGVLGAHADRLIERVARPSLPWPYGSVVR